MDSELDTTRPGSDKLIAFRDVMRNRAALAGYPDYEALLVSRLLHQNIGTNQIGTDELEDLNRVLASGIEFTRITDAIIDIGSGVLPTVRNALASPHAQVVYCACRVLARMSDPEAVEALLPVAQHAEGQIRAEAAFALANTGSERAVAPLLALLRDPMAYVRLDAARALVGLNRAAALTELPALAADDPDAEVRMRATQILASLGEDATLASLISQLSDKQWGAAGYAAQGLKRLGEVAFEPLLAAVAGHGRGGGPHLLEHAVPLLGHFRDPRALPVLLNLLRDSGNLKVRTLAAQALGKVGELGAVSGLINALADRKADVRAAAAEALGCLKAQDAGPALLALVANDARMTPGWVALAKMRFEPALEPALAWLNKDWLEADAQAAFAQFDQPAALPLLDRLSEVGGDAKVRASAQRNAERVRKRMSTATGKNAKT